MADDFSLAWRVFDVQYWGNPPVQKTHLPCRRFCRRKCRKNTIWVLRHVWVYSAWLPPVERNYRNFWERRWNVRLCLPQWPKQQSSHGYGGNTQCRKPRTPPCVIGTAGFCTEHSAQTRSIRYEEETSPTWRTNLKACKLSEHGWL